MDFGKGVDDGQAIDFLVIIRLDIAAAQEAVDAIADAQVIAVFQAAFRGRHVVDKGAVHTLQIDGIVGVAAKLDADMAARHRVVVNENIAFIAAADNERAIAQRMPAAHARSGWINVDQARIAIGRRKRQVCPGTTSFGEIFHKATNHGGRTSAPALRSCKAEDEPSCKSSL